MATASTSSLNFDNPAVIRLVMDSLRYWVEVTHVDGFRFDLASVLGRAGQGGIDLNDDGVPDLTWFGTDGGAPNWADPALRTLCYQLDASEDASDRSATRLFFILHADPAATWVALPVSLPRIPYVAESSSVSPSR